VSRTESPARRDLAALVLAWTVPLLPARRRDWGEAMQAELAGIVAPPERRRFTRGCALAIVRRADPVPLASFAVLIAIVLATVVLTAETAYQPLHFGLIAMTFLLGLIYLTGGRVALLAPPPARSRLAGAVRAGGALTLGSLALGIVLSDRSGDGNVVDRATSGVPIFTVLIALYLVGFMALTSRALTDTLVLVRGVSLGLGAAAIWLVFVLARPPLPLTSRSAFAVLAIAILAAAVVGALNEAALLTALCTTLVGALSMFVVATLALAFGPASWVPSDTAALTPAARLAQSRVEARESYLQLILIGALAALAIAVVAYRHRALGSSRIRAGRGTGTAPHRQDPRIADR
jgi:hypothetical protein